MDELWGNLTSPYWWLSVVLVSVLINLASAYLKSAIDRLFSRIFSAWRARSDQRQAAHTRELAAMVGNSELQRQYEHMALRRKLDALFGLVFSLFVLLYKGMSVLVPALSISQDLGISAEASNAVFYILSSLLIFVSFKAYLHSMYIEDILATAQAPQQHGEPSAL